MKKEPSKLFLIFIGAITFNIIFWQEKLGVNTLIFDAFVCTSVCVLFPYALKNKVSLWILAGHILCGAMIVIDNTLLSEISFTVTLLLFISFAQYLHRSAWYAAGSAFLNYIFAIPNFVHELAGNKIREKQKKKRGPFRMLLIPLFIAIVFIIIYSFANGIFSDFINKIVASLTVWLKHLFTWFSPERILFFLSGIIIVAGLLLRSRSYFSDLDLRHKNDLSRKKDRFKQWRESPFADVLHIIIGQRAKGILALKNEYFIGKASLILLNILLVFINAIDVKYIWLGYAFSNSAQASENVHEGTGMLILSVLLAILLLLFFFRGNINFYKKSKWLKYFAYLWIVQNFFLVLSVFNRDYYYIFHCGLAYKRIELLFFLVMVLSGLVTLFLKIHLQKTTYYLLRLNAWVGIILMVCASTVNWDVTIAAYNIARKNFIPPDVHFLLSLSDKTLPLIAKNKEILQGGRSSANQFYYNGNYYNYSALEFFEFRKKEFLDAQQKYTWLSWNIADVDVKKAFLNDANLSSLK